MRCKHQNVIAHAAGFTASLHLPPLPGVRPDEKAKLETITPAFFPFSRGTVNQLTPREPSDPAYAPARD